MSSLSVVLVGGAGPPAPLEFASLIAALDPTRPVVPVDMVAFHGWQPVPDFSMATETTALLRSMDEAGTARGHMVGYSGGAAVVLAVACAYPECVASLTLEEVAWIGSDGATALETSFWSDLAVAMALPSYEALLRFRDLMVRPEARGSLPPVTKDAPWIDSMVDGVRASMGAFAGAEVDWATLQGADFPIYAAVGSLSNPVFELRSRRLAERVPRATVEVFQGMHHVAPPHRRAPEEWAGTLEAMWTRAE